MKKYPLKFGSSGIRDLAENITDKSAFAFGCGFYNFLVSNAYIQKGSKILGAGDLRPSTTRIMNALFLGYIHAGAAVIDCGRVGTPVMANWARCRDSKNLPGSMVTASHNPENENGIKPYLPGEEVLKEHEEAILKEVTSAYFSAPDIFDEKGMLVDQFVYLNVIDESQQAENDYIKRYTDFFGENMKGLKIGLWQQSAVSRDIVEKILIELGAEVVEIARAADGEFVSVDTESMSESRRTMFREWVRKYSLDALISMDGDADRPIFVDSDGNFIPGDILNCEVSKYLELEAICVTASRNDAVDKELNDLDIIECKIGSPHIIKQMNEVQNIYNRLAGFEGNGGFMFRKDLNVSGRVISALPTRDCVLPVLCAIAQAVKLNVSTAELFSKYNRVLIADKIKLFPTSFTKAVMEHLVPDSALEIDFSGELSGDHLLIKSFVEQYFDVKKVGKIKKIRYMDGVRVFVGDNSIHLRASQNSPEFRAYINTDDMRDAAKYLDLALKEIVPKMVWDVCIKPLTASDYDGKFSHLLHQDTDLITIGSATIKRTLKGIKVIADKETYFYYR